MSPSTRVAVVGAAGWAGRRHIEAFRQLYARVVALIDPQPQVHELAERIGADVLEDTTQLSSDDVDLVVVALPSSSQPEVCADLLRRGFRVLVEKPIGSSAANASMLSKEKNVDDALMVGYTLHHHPVAQRLAEWVASSNVLSVSVRSAAHKHSIDSWRADPAEGGVVVVNGIHAIEYAASLFSGEASVRDAVASNGLYGTRVPDYTAATVAFDDGPVLRLETYWNPWDHTSGLNGNDWSLEVDVVAHEGRRVWSNWSLHEWERFGPETVRHFPERDLFARQAEAALAFAQGQPPTVGYRQALRATRIADAIADRAREGM